MPMFRRCGSCGFQAPLPTDYRYVTHKFKKVDRNLVRCPNCRAILALFEAEVEVKKNLTGLGILGCELCRRDKVTEHLFEDEICWVAFCKSHRDKRICVYNWHVKDPPLWHLNHMVEVMVKLCPEGVKLREPRSIKDHHHYHEV